MSVRVETPSLSAMQCNLAGQMMATGVIARVVRERLATQAEPLCADARVFVFDMLTEIDAYTEAIKVQLRVLGGTR